VVLKVGLDTESRTVFLNLAGAVDPLPKVSRKLLLNTTDYPKYRITQILS